MVFTSFLSLMGGEETDIRVAILCVLGLSSYIQNFAFKTVIVIELAHFCE